MKKIVIVIAALTSLLFLVCATDAEENGLSNATDLSDATEPDGKNLIDTSFSSCQICNESMTLSASCNETIGMIIAPPSIEKANSVVAEGEVLNLTGGIPKGVPTQIGAPAALDAQNAYRLAVGESPLVWSTTLASSAQIWAQHLADTNTFMHSCPGGGCGYGENLAVGWPSSYWSDASLVTMWGNEKQYFKCGYFPDVSTTGDWTNVGHYTQIVWPATSQCGCGEAISSADHKILVCQYKPPGNFIGKYICLQSGKALALRASNGQYVCAEGGGGGTVGANCGAISAWVTFNLVDRGNGNVALQASNGQYVCAEGGGGGAIVANRNAIGAWETFKLVDLGNGNYALQAANGQYVCAEGSGGGAVVANRNTIGAWETFGIIDLSVPIVPAQWALQAANGQYVCAEGSGGGAVVANRNAIGAWETFKLIDRGNGNVALQAANSQYVCAEGGGGDGVVANRDAIGAWETFKLIDLGNNNVALQAANSQYVCAEGSGGDGVVANRNAIGAWETFKLIPT